MATNPLTTDVGAGLIRTITPYATAYIVAYLAKNGIVADSEEVNAQFALLAGSLWYALVRALEQKWPKAGWLLGMAKQPSYDPPKGS